VTSDCICLGYDANWQLFSFEHVCEDAPALNMHSRKGCLIVGKQARRFMRKALVPDSPVAVPDRTLRSAEMALSCLFFVGSWRPSRRRALGDTENSEAADDWCGGKMQLPCRWPSRFCRPTRRRKSIPPRSGSAGQTVRSDWPVSSPISAWRTPTQWCLTTHAGLR